MNSLEGLKEELRGRLAEYLRQMGIKVEGNGKNIRCPIPANHKHGDANPSAMYSEEGGAHVHCYGCGGHWDIFALHQTIKGCDFMTALRELAEIFGLEFPKKLAVSGMQPEKRTNPAPPPLASGSGEGKAENPLGRDAETEAKLEAWAAAFKGSAGEKYLAKRGISLETASRYRIGFDAAFKWPDGTNGALVFPEAKGYGLRNLAPAGSEEKLFRHFPKGVRNGSAFNLSALWEDAVVFIVEGQGDALAVAEGRGVAVALGGVQHIGEIISAAKWKKPTARIIVSLDLEEGDTMKERIAKATRELTAGLRDAGAFVYSLGDECSTFGPFHDANDALLADREFFRENIKAAASMAEEAFAKWQAAKEQPEQAADVSTWGRYLRTFSSLGDPTPEDKNPDALIPNGYLRRGHVFTLVSCAGVGKSVLTNQLAISWAAGKECLHIPAPLRRLSIFVIQYEDDAEEMKEFIHDDKIGFLRSGWTQAELTDALSRVEFLDVRAVRRETKNPLADESLVELISTIQRERRFDVIIINPLTSALAKYDLSDNQQANEFLRQKLQPILEDPETAFLLVLIHHTGKVPKSAEARAEFMRGMHAQYDAQGAAALMNWTRASLMIAPTEKSGVFVLVGAKRQSRLKWKDREGKPTNEKYISYSPDIKFWINTPETQIEQLETSKESKAKKEPFDEEGDVRVAVGQIKQQSAHRGRMLTAVECRDVAGAAFTFAQTARRNLAWRTISKAPAVYGLKYLKLGRFEYYGPEGVPAPSGDGEDDDTLLEGQL